MKSEAEVIRCAKAASIAYAMQLIKTWKDVALEDVRDVANASCAQVDSLNGQEALVEQSIRDAVNLMYEVCEKTMDKEVAKLIAGQLMENMIKSNQSSLS